nr:hypothetical protein [Tanacetum cinerariifolium]
RLAGFLGTAAGTEEEQAKNFQWGLRRIPVMDVTKETGVISPTDLPILVLSNPGVPLRATLIQFSLLMGVDTKESVVELQADKKPGASGRVFAITEGQAANTSGSQQSRGLSEGYSYPVCTTYGRRHQGECRRAAGTCFKCGQAGHLQKDCRKNTTTSTFGHADKKPGASGRVFAITEGQAANTSGTI